MIIDDILDMMDDLLDKGQTVPFSVKKIIVDGESMRDCINDVRLNLPTEIREAKNIVFDRKTIITGANKEAEQLVRKAEERAKIIVSSDEITKAARAEAAKILNLATSKSRDVKNAANKYIEDTLMQTEERLQASLSDIRKTRQAVRTQGK
ncbi:MAG: ATPase [Oscillospiraceae bacterium]|nr:ATPase [Oscillospiraceae bacterium]